MVVDFDCVASPPTATAPPRGRTLDPGAVAGGLPVEGHGQADVARGDLDPAQRVADGALHLGHVHHDDAVIAVVLHDAAVGRKERPHGFRGRADVGEPEVVGLDVEPALRRLGGGENRREHQGKKEHNTHSNVTSISHSPREPPSGGASRWPS